MTDEWIKKMWYIYAIEYYSAIKKNEIMPFAATWMDLEIIILSEVSQTDREIQMSYNITYIWNLKYDTEGIPWWSSGQDSVSLLGPGSDPWPGILKLSSAARNKNSKFKNKIKYDTNEFIYKTETDSETQKTNLWLPKGKVREG